MLEARWNQVYHCCRAREATSESACPHCVETFHSSALLMQSLSEPLLQSMPWLCGLPAEQ